MSGNDQMGEMAQVMNERAATYSFLARVLSEDEVTIDFLKALRDDPPITGTDLDGFAKSLVQATDQDLEDVRKELAADHSATLLGMSRVPVSPYESVYTSEQHLMMQDARDEVLHAYRENGFEKDQSYHVPEDHVSLELDFMAALARRAADELAAEAARPDEQSSVGGQGPVDGQGLATGPAASKQAKRAIDAQAAFMANHLQRWIPQLADDLEARATTGFYKGVAQVLRGFVADDAEYLRELRGAGA